MSLDLMMRVYYKHPPLTEAEIFQKMVRGVELWGQKIDSWRTFQVTNPKHGRGNKSHHGDFTEEQVLDFSNKHKHKHSNYHASLPVSCWRWNSVKASMLSEHVYLDVHTWDQLRMHPFWLLEKLTDMLKLISTPPIPIVINWTQLLADNPNTIFVSRKT